MPRNISFAMTKEQVRARTKTQTRRFAWWKLKPDTILQGVEKGMGLKPGEKVVKLALIRVTDVRVEPLNAISQADVIAEGFAWMCPAQFVDFLLSKYPKIARDEPVNVITFEYLDTPHKGLTNDK